MERMIKYNEYDELEYNNLEWKEIPFGDESEKAAPVEEEKESGMGSMPRGWNPE